MGSFLVWGNKQPESSLAKPLVGSQAFQEVCAPPPPVCTYLGTGSLSHTNQILIREREPGDKVRAAPFFWRAELSMDQLNKNWGCEEADYISNKQRYSLRLFPREQSSPIDQSN